FNANVSNRSSFGSFAFVIRIFEVNAPEQDIQLLRTHSRDSVRSAWEVEVAAPHALRSQVVAGAVPPQQLHPISGPVAEHKNVTAHGLLLDSLHGDRFEAFPSKPAVGHAAADVEAGLTGDAEHGSGPRVDEGLQEPSEPHRV